MNKESTPIYSISIEDSLESIFQSLEQAVLAHRDGKIVEIDFSQIRARGDIISSTQKASEGPVTFLKIFDLALNNISSRIRKESPNAVIISVQHPDLLDFINYTGSLKIKIKLTPNFIRATETSSMYQLIDPHTNTTQNELDATNVLELLTEKAESEKFGIIYPSEEDFQSALPFDARKTYEEIVPPPVIAGAT